MTIKKKRCSSIVITLIFSLLLACIPFDPAFAVKGDVNPPAQTTLFSSSDTFADEYCKATVSGTTMTIKFQTMIPSYEFRLALYGVNPSTKVQDLGIRIPAEITGTSASTGKVTYGFEYTIDFSTQNAADGEYFIYISKIQTAGAQYESLPSQGALYKNLVFRLTDGVPMILQYDDVIAENERVQAIGADYDPIWYLDEYLTDIRFTLKDPVTGVYDDMTDSKIRFMQNMSNQITAGASSDYAKLLKIYEYVANEFYYDSVAFSTHSLQYADPYNNLSNHVNKVASANSDNQGRVATTCQGFSAIFLSLARAQGIPTRFVYGHRVTSPNNNWATEANISARDHWWVESYVNGRWIFIDPTVGTNNTWNKTTNIWSYYGLTNYTFFDPSEEQIAISHIYHNIYPDKRWWYLITDENELSKVSVFLESTTNGVKNGTILNADYDKDDLTTWGDGLKSHYMGDGYGNTVKIQWSYHDFTGGIDFSDFSKLTTLSMHHNALTSADLSGCTALQNVYLYNNALTSVDLSNCKNLQFASVTTGNLLKDATIYANGRNVNITAGDNGAFQIKYNAANKNKLQVIFKPNIGYKVEGFYNGDGKLVTTASSYAMNPGWKTYDVTFCLDPDSYKYELSNGKNTSDVNAYNMAAQKRLSALGYYTGSINGVFGDEMEEAVKTFQLANKVTVTGVINSATWSKLFSPAIKNPGDDVLQEIAEINGITLQASSAATKGAITVKWTETGTDAPTAVDGYRVYRSLKKDSGYGTAPIFVTENMSYKNTKSLAKGTRYYYKVRAYKVINGKTYYSPYSSKTYRIAK